MADIKDIAGTLQTNTKQQGEDLLVVDANMDKVQDNAEDAHEEIMSAQKYQKKSNKCLFTIAGVLSVVVVIIIIIVACTVTKN